MLRAKWSLTFQCRCGAERPTQNAVTLTVGLLCTVLERACLETLMPNLVVGLLLSISACYPTMQDNWSIAKDERPRRRNQMPPQASKHRLGVQGGFKVVTQVGIVRAAVPGRRARSVSSIVRQRNAYVLAQDLAHQPADCKYDSGTVSGPKTSQVRSARTTRLQKSYRATPSAAQPPVRGLCMAAVLGDTRP